MSDETTQGPMIGRWQRADNIAIDAAVPRANTLFEPVHDHYGLRLALVFGNHFAGGRCPYIAGEHCHHCDIGLGEGGQFDRETNQLRLAWFREHYASLWPSVAHLVLYNSGSVLNPRELPPDLLDEILDFAGTLPALRAVSLDSREGFVNAAAIHQLAERVGDGRAIRPIMGLETADDRIRNDLLEKQMPRDAVVRAIREVQAAGASTGRDRVGLDVNVVIAGPGTSPETAVDDAVETARFAFQLGREFGICVDLNIHPYYPSTRGRARFPDHDRCSLSILGRAMTAICRDRSEAVPNSGIFIGWQDEGHDQEPEQHAEERRQSHDVINQFNSTQDATVLTALCDPSVDR